MIERDQMESEEFRDVGGMAQGIMLGFLRKLKKDPTDPEALEYFQSPEYERWFNTPLTKILKLLPEADVKTLVRNVELNHISQVKPVKVEKVWKSSPENRAPMPVKKNVKPRITYCKRCGEQIVQTKNGNRKYCASCGQYLKKELAKVNKSIRENPIESEDLLTLFGVMEKSRADFIQAAKKIEKILRTQAETIKKSPCGDTGK
jgi:ribosomal protein L37E|nr:MAG TPA: 30S ribosomal protein S11 [Caudoviricetes sp.]